MENETIENLQALHDYSKLLIHSVIQHKDYHREETDYSKRTEPYQPSMFIYAFFVFNTFCNYDWKEAEKDNFSTIKVHKRTSDIDKIYAVIDMVANICLNNTSRNNLLSQPYRKYIQRYLKNTGQEGKNYYSWSYEQLQHIVLAPTHPSGLAIDDKMKEEFIKAFAAIFGNDNNGDDLSINLRKLENLIYIVRNNLFHGSKAFNFFENGHDKRFVIYAGILTAINEVLINYATKMCK